MGPFCHRDVDCEVGEDINLHVYHYVQQMNEGMASFYTHGENVVTRIPTHILPLASIWNNV
jgi:hypothetical protein